MKNLPIAEKGAPGLQTEIPAISASLVVLHNSMPPLSTLPTQYMAEQSPCTLFLKT